MRNRNLRLFGLIFVLILPLHLVLCDDASPQAAGWPIAKTVYTTAEQQILPIGLPESTPQISPAKVSLYERFGYSAWRVGAGLSYEKRTELAPGYVNSPSAARLLSFFAITDIHITDKESPACVLYPAWNALFGPTSGGLVAGAWTPTFIFTTQVLDAAIQTINALHQKSPFDFGIDLGDNVSKTQYNELRWAIDVFDGKVITPSSGAHVGADTIDYQKPFKAAGLNKEIPWYTSIGNHDQYWMGIYYEDTKLMNAHIGTTILNLNLHSLSQLSSPTWSIDQTGYYMGVVDGSTPYGEVIGSGPEANFSTPPTVIADANRRTLATSASASRNYMTEFFTTTSKPIGHGFTQTNLDNDFASYTFEPKADVPLKVIVLDATCKKNQTKGGALMAYYGSACLDQTRIDWLTSELQKGQDEGKLMIIGSHHPIKPQASLTKTTPINQFYDKTLENQLLVTLHSYPNLILWIAGHRHQNIVTAQPNNALDPNDKPERSFWEVETSSLKDFPQQFRTFDIRRNSDNTISIIATNIDPAVTAGSPAAKSRDYAIGAARTFGATPATLADTSSHAYNVELVKQLSPEMQKKIANLGTPIK